jgi:predicted ATPase
MKIESVEIKNYPPIKNLKIENLGDIVIIAGVNGSGKTRLKDAISKTLQGQGFAGLSLRATREEEIKRFSGSVISVKQGETNSILTNYISSRRFGKSEYVGSFVQIDSQRNIATTKYSPVSSIVSDPDEKETVSSFYHQDFSARWQNFINYIHNKVAAYDANLAKEVKKGSAHSKEILKTHPNPLEKYKKLFANLLTGKELQDINPVSPGQFHYKDINNSVLPFSSLSSGEQEVVKVVFDLARKDIKHSIIVVDEPELHLHPALTFRLIETLKLIGSHTNQFIFLTHSADLISTYYSTGNVYFIDDSQSGSNQAHRLSDLSHSHKELVKLIGDNLGLLAAGKRIIFVEGETSSIDRLAYHAISQKFLPDAKVTPIGSVENLLALNSIKEQIQNSIFGINFYMIRDRDGLSEEQIKKIEKTGRVKCLKKRHLENYFLDSDVIFEVVKKLYLMRGVENLSASFFDEAILRIASEELNSTLLKNTKEYLRFNCNFNIPTVKAVDKKSSEEIKNEMTNNVRKSLDKLSQILSKDFQEWIDGEIIRLQNSLKNGDWKNEFLGKIIFNRLCCEVLGAAPEQIRAAYIDFALEMKPDEVFGDIINIFKSFND